MLEIRAMTHDDWPTVETIYAAGIATGDATFETKPPSWEEFDASRFPDHRLVAEADGEIVGWAALSPTSRRACYPGVVEHSVYVAERAQSRGIGRRLLEALLASASSDGRYEPLHRRNTTHALCPPKPNELETPISTCCGRASFGM